MVPYNSFTGRLIVIEPARRWQVLIDWNSNDQGGSARLTHAASNRIIQLTWQQDRIMMLDNLGADQSWKPITAEEMAAHGIILPPQQLAQILAGHMPQSLTQKEESVWEGKIAGSFLRISWSDEYRRLELLDITHGRKATLIIEP
jgi:hypothetical protein